MALKGKAKTDYQREYMRRRRSNARSNRSNMVKRIKSVRPSDGTERDDLRAASERLEAALGSPAVVPVEPQGHSPMMVGYVPPVD